MRVTGITFAFVFALAGCGSKQQPAPKPPPSNEAPQPPADPSWQVVQESMAHSSPTQSVELLEGGHVMKHDSSDGYQEEFYLKDVTDVIYVYEADWTWKHVCRMVLDQSAVTRFRYGADAEWNVSSILSVDLVFDNERSARDAISAVK